MNSGSRPIERMARTGELTPPGSRPVVRAYSRFEPASVSGMVMAASFPDRAPLRRPARPPRDRQARPAVLASGVLALPAPEVVGEIQEADLLVLGRGVQRRPLLDPGSLGDRVQDRVALLL